MGFIPPSFLPLMPIVLLCFSNIFMTFAWYGHLKFHNTPMVIAVIGAWAIAFFEYCLAVPANRIGYQYYDAAELKTMQEVITLIVFGFFSVFYLGQKITVYHGLGFLLIAAGAALVFFAPKLSGGV